MDYAGTSQDCHAYQDMEATSETEIKTETSPKSEATEQGDFEFKTTFGYSKHLQFKTKKITENSFD